MSLPRKRGANVQEDLDSLGELRDAAMKLGRHEAHYRQLSGNIPSPSN